MNTLVRVSATLALTFALSLLAAGSAAGAAPETASPPTITGKPILDQTLTAGNGLWRNSPTDFRYQWLRCDAKGNNCARIAAETAKTYTLDDADLGRTIIVLVTAENADGSQSANSHPSEVVTRAIAPTNTSAPTITGKPVVGQQLVADPGKYGGGAVDKYSFQWRRCDAGGSSCDDLAGATGQTYGVRTDDLDRTLRVRVTARNEYGTTASESKQTAVVTKATVPAVKTTVAASQTTTTCCQRVRLSGIASTGKAGEPITVLAREHDDSVDYPVAKTATGPAGQWSVLVTPMIATTYTIQTSTTKSTPVPVSVHPRVGFGISGSTFSAKITARDSFAGAVALFQVRTSSGWQTRELIVTNTASIAKFRVPLKRGRTYTVRIYLPKRQSGPGYLDGTSRVRRVAGRA
jgi:hypothetical protein